MSAPSPVAPSPAPVVNGLAKRVIPCLDVHAGRVVKGVNFVDLVDAGDPVALAKAYNDEGADELVFLDITASSSDRETTYDVVRRTADQIFIPLTVGGGVRTVDDIDRLLRAGADKVGINTAAIARPQFLSEAAQRFGAQCIVLSVDARTVPPGVPSVAQSSAPCWRRAKWAPPSWPTAARASTAPSAYAARPRAAG